MGNIGGYGRIWGDRGGIWGFIEVYIDFNAFYMDFDAVWMDFNIIVLILMYFEWILMDYISFIVHIFNPEKRSYYNLDRLWADAKIISIKEKWKTLSNDL